MAHVIGRCRSKGSDPNSAIGQSRYRVYGIPTTHDKGCYYMQQWNATVVSGLVAGVAMCNFLRTCEITFLYLKLASCENKLLILTSGNSKYLLWAEAKNQGSRTNMGQEDSTAMTGIAHWISISTVFQLLRCANLFYFSLGNFIFNIVLLAIFITQLAHSCFPFSFVAEALSAKVISHRTGRSADRSTATGTPHCGRRPECDCRWPGPGHSPPVGGAKPQRAAANGNRAGGSRSPGTGWY